MLPLFLLIIANKECDNDECFGNEVSGIHGNLFFSRPALGKVAAAHQ